MAFREKLAWVLLATTAVGYAIYVVIVSHIAGKTGWDSPVVAIVPALIGMIVWMTIVAVAGSITAAVSAPQDSYAPADERDRDVSRRASARAYPFLSAGIGLTIALMLFDMGLFKTMNLLVSVLVLAEIVRYAGEAWHYRRGA